MLRESVMKCIISVSLYNVPRWPGAAGDLGVQLREVRLFDGSSEVVVPSHVAQPVAESLNGVSVKRALLISGASPLVVIV